MEKPLPIPEGISGFKPKQAPATADMTAVTGQAPAMEGEEASPEEQALYERFTKRALLFTYAKEATGPIMEMVQSSADLQTGIGKAASIAAQRAMDETMKSERTPVPADIVLAGMEEIVPAVAEMVQTATGEEIGQEALNAAMMVAADDLQRAMSKSGAYSKEMAQADVAELQEMDRSGGLERFMGGPA